MLRKTSPWWLCGILAATLELTTGCQQASNLTEKAGLGALVDLAGQPVNLRGSSDAKAVVLLFVSVDCPISNRYAPEVRRLHARFAPRHILFRLVYLGTNNSAEEIRQHLREFDYPCEALRDPHLKLARNAGIRVTPEAAVFLPDGRLAYRGRIDNRFAALGTERPAATQHDLDLALTELLDAKPVSYPHQPGVGCPISGVP